MDSKTRAKKLFRAARQGDVPAVTSVCDTLNECVGCFLESLREASSERTLLHIACEFNRLELVNYLLSECRMDINIRDRNFRSPLHEASTFGHLGIVKLLVNWRGVHDHHDRSGACKLKLDLQEQNTCILDARKRGDWTAFMLACAHAQKDVAQELISRGVETRTKNREGSNALILAIRGGHYDIVRLLVDHFFATWQVETCIALLNEPSNNGRTPLMTAAFGNHEEILELLLSAGANPYNQDHSGSCAAFDSIPNPTCFKALLADEERKGEAPKVLEIRDHAGLSILHYVISHPDSLRLVLDYAQKYHCLASIIDVKDSLGRTSLQLATAQSNLDAMQLLIEYGANPSSSSLHRTIIETARITKNRDVIEKINRALAQRG